MDRLTAMTMMMSRALAVEPRALKVMIAIASRDEFFSEERRQALEARQGDPLQNTRLVTVRDGVAIIPVTGPLVRHASMFDEISGATSYADLRKDLQAALDNPTVTQVLWVFNSPGGECTGCGELSEAIFQARSQKPQIAYVDGMACSAGYWLASACEEIVMAPTSEAGSIGVMMAWLDDTDAMAQAGFKEIRFTSSQSPNKNPDPATDAGKTQFQQICDDTAAVFVADVARNRGVDRSVVLSDYGKGALMVGARAVDAGLADRLGDFEAVLAEMVDRDNQRSDTMFTTKVAAVFGLDESATEEQVFERVAAAARSERDMIAATGAADADDAIGRVRANAEASAELAKIHEEQLQYVEERKRAAEVKLGVDFRGMLEAAVSPAGRMSLAQLANVVPTFLDDKEAEQVAAKIEALEKQDAESILACFSEVKASSSVNKRVASFIGALGQLPKIHKESKADEHGGEVVDDAESRVVAVFERARAERAKAAQQTK